MFSGQGFSLSVKASFPPATAWTAEGAVVTASAPRELLSPAPLSRLPEVHFTSFPLPLLNARETLVILGAFRYRSLHLLVESLGETWRNGGYDYTASQRLGGHANILGTV